MFLRRTERKKNGKAHSYWNVVENKRLDDGRVVQRHVLYLGEINSSQATAWRKAIEVFDEDAGRTRTLALFPEDRCEAVVGEASIVQLRLSEMQLRRPRQWGACWLAGQLWRELQLDRFWADRLPPSRKGTPWDQILQVLASYRLIAPGSEWRLHREWFGNSAMADLLGADFGLAEEHKLYACHDLLLAHKEALFSHLVERWRDLFNADCDVLLYDLTSTYFEVNASDLPEGSGTRDAAAAVEVAVEAAPANRRDGDHARRVADETRRREGRYLLRTNLSDNDPAQLWQYHTQLVAVEEAFRNLKGDLAVRPVFHQDEKRIEAYIFIAFLAYCMKITLTRRLHALAPGLTARRALEKFAAVQMIDVHLPTTDGREILLTRYTHPEPELQLLIDRLKLRLPPQPPPRITTAAVTQANRRSEDLLT